VFIGHVSGPEKDFLYASSYFTLLLSHSENFGNVVVESLCQGTPVITSKGTPWEDIDRYKAGFWIENAPSAIAKVIDKIIILDSAEYNAYRLNSRYFVESNFDIEKKVDNWIIEYQNAINSK
jgi:glycosyltransferase involved in cell wall biosynthesis